MIAAWNRALLFFAVVLAACATGRANEPWEAPARAFERLPIQDGGRVKPIASFARFTLLRVAGRASASDAEGARLDAVEWLLRLVLFPELAQNDPVLLVEDSQALVAAGLADAGHRKRDRWAYSELAGVLPELLDRAHAAQGTPAGQRTSIQAQTVRVAESALLVLRLGRTFEFARHGIPLQEGTLLAGLFPARDRITIADVVEQAPAIAGLERDLASGGDGRDKGAISALWRNATDLCADAQVLAWIPPVRSAAQDADWKTPADLLLAARLGEAAAAEHVALLRAAEAVVASRTDPARLAAQLQALAARAGELAAARGELEGVGLEVAYQRWNLLRWSTVLFLLGFAACALGWLRPRAALPSRAAWLAALGALALLVFAIVLRCVIRGRPPVSTLYETVLFVTAAGVLVALAVERIQRQRIHLGVACLVGAAGLFLANGYEALDGQDTMPSLVAVLDTNFWLATHVTAITLGYSAGVLAAVLGSAYVFLALLRGDGGDPERQRSLARSVYGVTCFALFFAVVGTILGGIWANESWGRFWGWDPKENGALLICIAQIALVHARRAGLLRDLGVCLAAAFTGTIIAFSWWGVNLLGVGLHSYGFTSGIHRALWTYYLVQWSIVALGGLVWLRRRRVARPGARERARSAEDARTAGAAVPVNAVPPALVRVPALEPGARSR